ncbi:DHA2 family efflux MFS transporter permease subunit [Dyella acidiphila]|uniref:DHA2 family efflux MFS transporter permease subunit n=1 Tax=Dyella acidiphila TaxID=2775866 RepID=A0ABR9GBU7_9GAMM|nr:DHA2 family efflux MFS transporter permease subunit [Dyella acidiphila]MBE1161523.1 DHA2 family efflux MFS transporter permease subunit [Dyella acidiphila]
MARDEQSSGKLPPLSGGTLILFTAGVSLATFMEVLDISIVNVAVYTISGNLGVSRTEGTMAISAYSMASAVMQPLTGWIARRFGEVRTFSASILLFVIFSSMCGLSSSMPMLIVFRLLQGAVSGPMVPLSQTLLLNNYPAERRPIAMALWAMMVVVAPIFGPILGGWITDNYSWSWIFFINIPVGLFALLVTTAVMQGRESKKVKVRLDIVGLFLLAAGIGCLQFMLDNGNDYDWFNSNMILILAIIAFVCITFLIAWELMYDQPVIDLYLFKRRNFAVGVLCLFVGMFAFFGGTVVLPNWVQEVMSYTATWAGFVVAPVGIPAIFMSPLIGAYQNKFDLRILSTIGFAIFGVCSFWMAHFDADAGYFELALPRLLMGCGIAFFFVPVNQIILSGLPEDRVASASGLANFFRTIAMSVATAVSSTLYTHRSIYHHAVLSEHTHQDGRTTAETLSLLQRMGIKGDSAYAAINRILDMQAATLAINDVFWGFSLMFGVALVAVWFARPPFTSSKPAT